ncbi:MAG: hypothetical protein JW982_04290 [Spirochaetes bacterium]|nr:hypothetical protein [Spirochaetota bacterium]
MDKELMSESNLNGIISELLKPINFILKDCYDRDKVIYKKLVSQVKKNLKIY